MPTSVETKAIAEPIKEPTRPMTTVKQRVEAAIYLSLCAFN